jgi:hypothetical protein
LINPAQSTNMGVIRRGIFYGLTFPSSVKYPLQRSI